MNKRIRQWLRASEMLDRYDPMLWGCYREERGHLCMVAFRRSEQEEVVRKYGEKLTIYNNPFDCLFAE